jgi:hypothetical protein
MVYSQICSWLDDYVSTDPPEELLDEWDFREWLNGLELESMFRMCFIDMLQTRRAQRDSVKIFRSLLWEYYLLRKDDALSKITQLEQPLQMNNMCTSSNNTISTIDLAELACRGDGARAKLIKQKSMLVSEQWRQTVYLTPKKGVLSESAWTRRFKPVLLDIYAQVKKEHIIRDWATYKHGAHENLVSSVDALSDSGRLIYAALVDRIDTHIMPYKHYCAVQGSLEVLDGALADYCTGVITAGSDVEGLYCGVVSVVGDAADIASWTYVYSPVYENTKTGRRAARRWRPEQNVLERQHWTCMKFHLRPVMRNRRWWLAVGLPEYTRFLNDNAAAQKMHVAPKFLDDV